MKFFYVFHAKRLKQLTLILVAAFFTAMFMFMETTIHLPVFSTKDAPKALYKGEKGVALTFNIGWGDEKAEPILDLLKKEKVTSATFFLSGSWAESHPDIVERIAKSGYEIGILGYNYEDYTELEEDKIRQDLARAQTAFAKLNIKDIKYVRPPTGHFDKKTLAAAKQLGYTVVHWSLDSKDWTNPGTDKIIQKVLEAENGEIVLMHASDSVKQTSKALPSIINGFKKEQLELVTISEMMANANATAEEIN
ncbi:polysaccharide deacetylase family sporulation protein PdaB [Cytobacillus kochii]|uniref:polysaccharide deacetylase family sporulation protein PdaB n=1 Tax=Cytobacillus kochii TaxID=859143 RepID=UPI00203FD105|nr:polysaccharide deacetylase family sporulation protein PdaB [Cytobacillus kochii]MCM3324190.1 polysaccharide deacetylase family sporulation protein PdaB [Cytobacillus kochii]MCM3346741.1 polysaccharide deacetylase family sporulation protein PdaB [Cytobacillus kochii]